MTQLADNELTVQGIRYLNQRTYHRQAYIAVDVITIARLYQKVTKFKWFTWLDLAPFRDDLLSDG